MIMLQSLGEVILRIVKVKHRKYILMMSNERFFYFAALFSYSNELKFLCLIDGFLHDDSDFGSVGH
jgi:hypothetical protein